MKYRIAHGNTIPTLEAEVNCLLAAGWRPIGGLTTSVTPPGHRGPAIYFSQALTLETSP